MKTVYNGKRKKSIRHNNSDRYFAATKRIDLGLFYVVLFFIIIDSFTWQYSIVYQSEYSYSEFIGIKQWSTKTLARDIVDTMFMPQCVNTDILLCKMDTSRLNRTHLKIQWSSFDWYKLDISKWRDQVIIPCYNKEYNKCKQIINLEHETTARTYLKKGFIDRKRSRSLG